ncbi:glycosyltransferase family 2 protein [Ensifer sp. SL37]|uniref:glycosyltransferase family 2 protein n=1 Tax=Ensifer sp. SL37 TaxID=2995137 RepID=UPI002272C090|nr:glycosyltransferase family 2 protein [Ensifer sp. SL37]MCY1740376.1 glycosyltransferase family 2 protein [Ensifer sp. SL37]
MNILLLMAGEPRVQSSESYPLALTEIDGVPLIEKIMGQCQSVKYNRFIVAIQEQDIRRYRLDQVVKLLDDRAEVVVVEGLTQGAACTALLAAGLIDNMEPLLILNADEILHVSFESVVDGFERRGLDAGTIVFRSVHPRYSFVRLDEKKNVIEAAEKNPISNVATAGFYYFREGSDFVTAAKNLIRKDARQNDAFYVCPTFNELILSGKVIGVHEIEAKDYSPIKSDRQLQQFASHE